MVHSQDQGSSHRQSLTSILTPEAENTVDVAASMILQVLCSALAGWSCSVDQHFESFSLDDSTQTSHPLSNARRSKANSFGHLADNPFSFPAAILANILYMSSV